MLFLLVLKKQNRQYIVIIIAPTYQSTHPLLGVRVVGVGGVEDSDVGAPVEVRSASLAARTPRAVAKAGEVLDLRGLAGHRLGVEVGHEGGDGGVDVQRHQEQQRRERATHSHRQRGRHVELEPLQTGERRPRGRRRRLGDRLPQRPVQQQLRTAAVHLGLFRPQFIAAHLFLTAALPPVFLDTQG